MLAQKKKSIKVTTADLTELVKGGMEGIEEEISKLSETMEAVLGELQTMKEREWWNTRLMSFETESDFSPFVFSYTYSYYY